MRHLILTCKNHPNLRWSCKSLAFTPGQGYNGARNLFYHGEKEKSGHPDVPQMAECKCEGKDLILAPEDLWASLSEKDLKQKIMND